MARRVSVDSCYYASWASVLLATGLGLLPLAPASSQAGTVEGSVKSQTGEPVAGVFVTARSEERGIAHSVTTTLDGRYLLGPLAAGSYDFRAHLPGFASESQRIAVAGNVDGVDFGLYELDRVVEGAPGFIFLETLPEGKEKRRFILDCMGCHSLNQRIAFDGEGRLLDEAAHEASVQKMLAFAGAETSFPVMAPDRSAPATAKYLAAHLTEDALQAKAEVTRDLRAPAGGYSVTEYALPESRDFPHDLRLDGRGQVLVTGMFSGKVYRLDPESGVFQARSIPPPGGNPRAVDVDAAGDWWLAGGIPKTLSRFRVTDETWDHYDIGVYPHSTVADGQGRIWFNGHFTADPIQIGFVDARTGEVTTLEVPPNDMPLEEGGPIPYGLRIGPDGAVWGTELAGNRLVRFDPATEEFTTYTLPLPYSGPRRPDADPDGNVWIPEFATGRLARFDTGLETFEEYEFPTSNSLPYCARVDGQRGRVWISQCANDAIARLDLATGEIVEYRLPTQIAFIRHLDVDLNTGDVWAAYSHSPGLHPTIARIRVD